MLANYSNERISTLFARSISASLFAAVMAGTWDAWWHGALDRESFWSPPHIFLYLAVIAAIGIGWYAWYRLREPLWRRAALILALIPLSAPLDDFWHRFFGPENISSPIIVWSLPHLLLIFGVIASFVMLLPILRKDKDANAERLFKSISFAAILTLLFFVVSPFEPTGPHHLLGFWGAGIAAMVIVGTLLAAQNSIPGLAGATLTAAFFLVLVSIGLGEKMAPSVIIPPHDHPPIWLTVFSIFVPAVVLDLCRRQPLWIKGAAVGFLWSFLLFGFSSHFFEPQFQYSTLQALKAIGASTLGGVFISVIVHGIYHRTGSSMNFHV